VSIGCKTEVALGGKNTSFMFDKFSIRGCAGQLSTRSTIFFLFFNSFHSFEKVAKFKHLGSTLTDHNFIHEEIRSRLNSGNACYRAVQNILSSRLLSRNVEIKIYKIIILPVVLYGCVTLSLTLREEHRLRVFENRALRRIFGLKRDEVTGGWRKLHNEELHGLYSSSSIVRVIKARRMR
jgi:hypothetical protein